MKIISYFVSAWISFFAGPLVWAAPAIPANLSGFPKGCMPVGFNFVGKQVVLSGPPGSGQQQVYLFNNNSRLSIFLDHPADYPGTASAGWMSQLDPQQWSALTVTRQAFNWTCQAVGLATLDYIPCRQVLRICRFVIPEKKVNSNTAGEYWVSENQSLGLTLNAISLRNIKISTSNEKTK